MGNGEQNFATPASLPSAVAGYSGDGAAWRMHRNFRAEAGETDGRLAFFPGWLATAWGIALVVGAYRALYFLVTSWPAPVLGTDTVTDNILAQQLRFAYELSQPPLFEWLLWPVQQLVGPSALSFGLVKGASITLSAVFLLLAARFAIKDRRLAAVAVLSYGLLYEVGSAMLERLTQSALLMCCCAAALFTFCRALRSGRVSDHLFFGVALGAGLLTKFNFLLLPLALLAASATEPLLRRKLDARKLALSVLIVALLLTPFLYGVFAGGRPLAGHLWNVMHDQATAGSWRPGKGLLLFAVAIVECSLLLIPLLVIVFWKPLVAGALAAHDEYAVHARLFGKASLFAALVSIVGILLTGSTHIKDWHMLPILLPLPLWMFARIERAPFPVFRMRFWAWMTAAVVGLCAGARALGEVAPDAGLCGDCRSAKSYAALGRSITDLASGDATLFVLDRDTAGNLRAQLPHARILTADLDYALPRRGSRDCLAVWEEGKTGPVVPAFMRLPGNTAQGGRTVFVTQPWPRQWLSGRKIETTWGIRVLDPGDPLCR